MKKQYILLIDDDPDEFDFFLNALHKLPGLFECGHATNADEAIIQLHEKAADYIFMDMNMPAVNGLECTAKIKKTDGISDIPVFIYTTGYDETLKKKAIQTGASGCVRKPSQPALLVAMLKNLYETGSPELNGQGRNSIR